MSETEERSITDSTEVLLGGLLRLSESFSTWAKNIGQTPMWMSIPRHDEYGPMLRRLDDGRFEHIVKEARRLTDLAHEIGALQQRTAQWAEGLSDPPDDAPV